MINENKIPIMISCIDTGDKTVKFLQEKDISAFKFPLMTVKAMKAVVEFFSRK